MKLRIKESIDDVVYVGLMRYSDAIDDITEDMIQPDEVIKSGSDYNDQYDTRKFIVMYLKGVAENLKKFKSVKECKARPASKKTKKGLSGYLDIELEHPSDLNDDEVEKNYMFTIRYSDHKPSNTDNLIGNLLIIGMKPKNFEKVAIRTLKTNKAVIQKRVTDFEKQRYGKELTHIIFE